MPEEHKLRLGDTVEIDGEMWVWEGVRRGIEAKLRRDGTADDWLVNFDTNVDEIRGLMKEVYGPNHALWMRRWRRFYMATAGLFGDSDGTVWGVSHYRLKGA